MRRLRYSMLVTSLLIILGGVAWSGLTMLDGLTIKQSSIAAKNKTQFYTTRYQIARERLPHTPVEPADIKDAVELSDVLEEYKTTPLEMMQLVSFGLRRLPDIHLDNMEWVTSTNPEAQPGKKNRPQAAGNTRVNTPVDPNAPSYKYYQIAIIKGRLDPFNGDYRSAISKINSFAETLRSREYVTKVNVLSLPLDVSSDVSMQGSANTKAGDANFSIQVVMGLAKNET